tara:strand:+ start:17 stop:1204 length:1188 start_codon:yes stop_codon:yes gene_type:complete
MNAFFASIEQRDNPLLIGKPIAITNGVHGSCIITCSYEARAFGIKTGMRYVDAKNICPTLIKQSSNPERYAKISTNIMSIIKTISPDVEIFSVDEAFIDLTNCLNIYQTPMNAALILKDRIFKHENLPCSIGISTSKALAKFAAKMHKPNGITIIKPNESKNILNNHSVTELCGVSKGIGKFLNAHNVYKCGDMKNIPISILGNKYGNIGRKIWLMAQGKDIDSVEINTKAPKSFGHGKVTIPNLKNIYTIKKIFRKMSEKVATRMRKNSYESNTFIIGYKVFLGWNIKRFKLRQYTNNGNQIYKLCSKMISVMKSDQGIYQIQITALKPRLINLQSSIFKNVSNKQQKRIDSVMDNINEKYCKQVILPARILHEDGSPDVIAPSWRPDGFKRSV